MAFIVVLIFFLSFCFKVEAAEVELNLKTIIERALQNHPQVLASEKGLQEAKGFIRQAGLRPDPTIELSGGSSAILGESGDQEWGVQYIQPLELGNKRKKRLNVAEIGLMIASQQLQEQKRQLILEIKKQFAEFLSVQSNLEATNRSIELHKKLHEFTVAKVNEGEAAAVEKTLSQIELSRLELEQATLATELAAAQSRLKIVAGLNEGESITGSLFENITIENADLAKILATAKERNPQVQISILEYQQAEASLRLAKAGAVPDLNVFLAYSNEKSKFDAFGLDGSGNSVPLEDSDQILSTGISFNLPFSRNQGNIAAAIARMEQAKIKTEFLEKSIDQEITSAFRKYEIAKEAYKTYRDAILKESETQIEIMRVSFESGELRFLDWLNEQKRAFEIQKSFVTATREYFLAAAQLEFLSGSGIKPVEEL
jgi:cobalt-zinc-cadmium efflux system outer membrane protein